jgi:hypothetical protein
MVLVVEARHVALAKSTRAKSTCVAKAGDVTSGKAADVGTADAADVGTAEAPNVAAAHAANVAAAEAATMAATEAAAMAAAATAAAGLCARRKQASGEHCACQNHHRSSFHDILHLDWRMFRHSAWSGIGLFSRVNADAAIDWRCECPTVFSTKFFSIKLFVLVV